MQHLRVEENPILEMPHLEAASILLVGPTLKKFNDRGVFQVPKSLMILRILFDRALFAWSLFHLYFNHSFIHRITLNYVSSACCFCILFVKYVLVPSDLVPLPYVSSFYSLPNFIGLFHKRFSVLTFTIRY